MIIEFIKIRKVALTAFAVILLYFNLSTPVYAEDANNQKNVLVINSYNHGLAWTADETDGILTGLKKNIDNLSIFIEYLDWKNNPTENNLRAMVDSYRYKYQNKDIDMIITTDDTALEFALKNRSALFSNAPVVFCGVNRKGVSEITSGFNNFTGVVEEVDPIDTINMALKINPSLKNVYVLFDNSESGISTGNIVIEKIKAMDAHLNTIPLNQLTYDELINSVKSYKDDSIIFATTYYSDANGKIIEFERASRDISTSSTVPVYHLYDFGLNNGAFGGNLISGELQGMNAARLALRIINGENPDYIPVQSPKTTRKVFDYNQLKRFNVSLSKIPKDSEVINKPFSFFNTYRILVLAVLAVFAIMIVFVCILLFYINKIRRMKKNLSDNHEELTQIYEELTASDEELKQQFDEISAVQESLSKSEERFRIAADGSNAVIWDADMSNSEYQFSNRWYELLGYEKNEVDEVHSGWKTIIHPDDQSQADKSRNAHLNGETQFYNCEYRMRTKAGEYLWFNVRGKVLKDINGKNIRFAGSMIDITEKKKYETKLQESYQELEAAYEELTAVQEELILRYDETLVSHKKIKENEERFNYLAYHDVLTELPNKLSLYEDSNVYFSLPQTSKTAVLFIDIDNFKNINDAMGHAFGDQVIIKMSERMVSLINDGCTLYRLSGDEFIVIVQNVKDTSAVGMLASHILAGFKDEFDVMNSVLHISISIGIAFYPEHGNDVGELLKYADMAMYRAKEEGRNKYVVYDQLMNEAFTERINLEKHLHTALERNEFEIYYQPQLDLRSNEITGFEALLRWKSPELGSVSPLKFIKVAEDTHLIIPLGAWVLKNACAFLKKLHNKGYTDLTISVNISILQLLQTDFNDLVIETLKFCEIKPEYLELEVTESILMESFETIGKKLEILRDIGIKIALDDFGKGYSSLSYLKQLPISTLKIDKSFIDCVCSSDESDTLTEQIIKIGTSMGMIVIAEGVENQEQLEYLINHECHKIQGYLFSRPIPEFEVEKLLKMR